MKTAAVLGSLWLIACTVETAASLTTPNGAVPSLDAGFPYTSTRQVPVDASDVSLCELARHYTGGSALYRVESLTGFTERDEGGSPNGFTYVQLRKIEDLGGEGLAPVAPLARFSGGPTGSGTTKIWNVALTVGESYALMLLPASAANRGFLGLHPLAVFRMRNGGYTNEQIFTQTPADLDTLRSAFRNAAGPQGCVRDTFPDRQQPAAPVTPPLPHPDAGPAVLDGGTRDDAGLQWPVLGYEFVLVNATAAPLYVQESDFAGGLAFLALHGTGPLQFQGSCSICDCDSCSNCGVCGRSLARVRRIEAGASHRVHWAGNIWEEVALSCGGLPMCQRRIGAPTMPLTAFVTYSDSFDVTADFGSNDELVRQPTRSASAQFLYIDGARTTIELH